MPRRDAPGVGLALLCMLFLGVSVCGLAVRIAALEQDREAIRFLMFGAPLLAALGSVVCGVLAFWVQRRARVRERAARLARREGVPVPEARAVALGLIEQAIHAARDVHEAEGDARLRVRLGDLVGLLEGAAALLERERDGGGDGA